MADISDIPTSRADARAAGKARRTRKAALQQITFEAMAAGWTVEHIAEMRKVSPRTIRREIDRTLDQRRLAAPERYAHLQVARLTKALRLADAALDAGDLKALAPFVKIVAALDRYHGLAGASLTVPPVLPAETRPALAAPPLRLTSAVAQASLRELEGSEFVTSFSA